MDEENNNTISIKNNYEKVTSELGKIIVGQQKLLKHLYICILCEGHALIEGAPGLGKTLIVKSLSKILDLTFSRIQFTPDLMPSDILGTNMVNEDERGKRSFEFYKGPIFGQIILADEINRASPKTQSALLEAMQEQSVTIFGKNYSLTLPFIVIATQNPLEMEGTYPLPEAQIDRFFFKLKTDYPGFDELNAIIDKTTCSYSPKIIEVLNSSTILTMKKQVMEVPIATHIKEYVIRLILATHPNNPSACEHVKQYVHFGASPRGAQSLILASKAFALLEGRYNVSYDDIRAVAKPALRHRLILNMRGEAESIDNDEIIEKVFNTIPHKS